MNDDGQRRGDDLDRSAAAAAHALDTTDAAEAAEVEAEAAASMDARGELDSFRETATVLGLALEPVEPPASLRAELLAKVAMTAQVPRDERPATSGLAELGLVDSVPLSPEHPLLAPQGVDGAADSAQLDDRTAAASIATPAERKARHRWFERPVALVGGIAAAAALLIGGGFAGSAITSNLNDTSAVTASAEQLAEIASAPDSRSARSTVDGGSTATVVWSDTLGRSAVLVDDLSSLPSDQTYEAWYIGSDQVTAAGTFDAGDSTTWHVLDGTKASGDAIAVTVEPAGGSDQPTTVPILVVESA